MSVAIRAVTRAQDLDDFGSVPGAGNDGYVWTWDYDALKFVLTAPAAPFAGLLATGATVGATSQAQAFTLGVVSPFVAPSADSTTAFQVRKADKTTSVLNVDTTNARVGIGTAAPSSALAISFSSGNTPVGLLVVNTAPSGPTSGGGIVGVEDDGAAVASGDRLGYFLLGGATDSIGTIVNSCGFTGLATGNWTPSSAPTDLAFYTCPAGTTTRSELLRLTSTGLIGIGTATPTALVHADQSSATGAVPVLTVDQADVSEEFIRFIGTSTTDASQSLVDAANMTTPGALAGWLKIYVRDDQATNPITDGAYYVPFYAAPTA